MSPLISESPTRPKTQKRRIAMHKAAEIRLTARDSPPG